MIKQLNLNKLKNQKPNSTFSTLVLVLILIITVSTNNSTWGQSKSKLLVNVSIGEDGNESTFQRYESLKDGASLIYLPSKSFRKVRVFRVELNPQITRSKYPDALLKDLKITFHDGNDAILGEWTNKGLKDRHKAEIYAGYGSKASPLPNAQYAILTSNILVKGKSKTIKTFVQLRRAL